MRMVMTGHSNSGTPYEQGEAAYNRGESLLDNPYPKGSKEYTEWNRGMCVKGDPGL